MTRIYRLFARNKKGGLLRFLLIGVAAIILLITIIGYHYVYDLPKMVSILIFFTLLFIVLFFRNKKFIWICITIGFIVMIISVRGVTPSNDQNWATEFSVLPRMNITDDKLIINGFRNFQWHSKEVFDPVWEERIFDLQNLKSLDFIVEPFKDSELMAHTMLRFGFGDGKNIVVSVEARREKHEKFSLVAGSFRQFELIYLFGDEKDIIDLRVIHVGAQLYIYPVKADQKFIVDLFLDLVSSANELNFKPRFYRSILDNCTTTLVKHFDRLHTDHVGIRYETIFPVLTGKLLHQRGYINTILSYEKAREYFRVDQVIRRKKGRVE